MDIFQAIIIGIIEGFTEFLPISSTGHMIVASEFLGINQDAVTKAYEVIIQFAAILAVMLIYKEKITFKKIDLWVKLFIAFLPLAIVGFIFKDHIKALFNVETVAWMFIIGGVIFLIVEYFYNEKAHTVKEVEEVSYVQALWVGFSQIFSLIPGTSRAGATIIGGMLAGLDRKTSSDFSFLLAIPVMAAVSAYDLLKHYKEFADADLTAFGIGFLTAFVVAYITVKLFLSFIQKFTFVAFGVYRIIFGILLLIFI
jgi:undecaprenyl-diphosphatase